MTDTPPAGLAFEIRTALNRARKSRDRLRTTVLSSTLAEIGNREIELGRAATEEEIRAVLARAVKQRREAAEQMRRGGREELAEKEETEQRILAEFLPPALEEAEVREMVRRIVAAGTTEMGPVMGRLMPQLAGRFDGKDANRIVREELSG